MGQGGVSQRSDFGKHTAYGGRTEVRVSSTKYTTTGAEGRAGEIPRMRDPKGDTSGNEGVNYITRKGSRERGAGSRERAFRLVSVGHSSDPSPSAVADFGCAYRSERSMEPDFPEESGELAPPPALTAPVPPAAGRPPRCCAERGEDFAAGREVCRDGSKPVCGRHGRLSAGPALRDHAPRLAFLYC